jgi:hypothetical protein
VEIVEIPSEVRVALKAKLEGLRHGLDVSRAIMGSEEESVLACILDIPQ